MESKKRSYEMDAFAVSIGIVNAMNKRKRKMFEDESVKPTFNKEEELRLLKAEFDVDA